MFNRTFRKIRPNRAAMKREKRGLYVCCMCGQECNSLTGVIDDVTRLATCGRCIERTAESEVGNE